MAAIGLVRLADVYSRLSAVTKAATLGVVLVLGGAFCLEPSWKSFFVVGLAAFLQFFTAPVGGFALGRAAYRAGSPLAPQTQYDELDDAIRATSREP
ncbi:monovalent cation/H(+) antiporter subunit G [Actinobacteria bacterium YIM 96077]|uniref:Cation:proton antiporter n=2 Tax=Phytoactinopolyspora halophila TaxID=1981511 RepID=A0A329R0J6_9ACTN|nr:monovalent cation/H(+) antiporter subunit G [Actinobacteria bacterium YIM 96077]RAW18144.1 cation:proton antiporter [Phytoactinopolyspora halophila]